MRAFMIVIAALLIVAQAAVAEETFVWYYGLGTGDFMDSPPVFTGPMDPSGMIEDGSWTITINDTGWPTTPPETRYQYIWNTFFAPNYVPGTPSVWTGYFDTAHGLPALNTIAIVDNTNVGTMSGVCSVQIGVQDLDNDMVLDEGEFCTGSLAGIVVIIRDGTGCYDGMCGTGNYYGTYVKACPGTAEEWNFGMYLWLEDCSTPTENTSWGSIKALFQ
jgi:hypothetical protein